MKVLLMAAVCVLWATGALLLTSGNVLLVSIGMALLVASIRPTRSLAARCKAIREFINNMD